MAEISPFHKIERATLADFLPRVMITAGSSKWPRITDPLPQLTQEALAATIQKSYCSKCHAPIAWIETIIFFDGTRKRHPVDWFEPPPPLAATGYPRGALVYLPSLNVWRILRGFALDSFLRLGGVAARSHFDSCEFAADFRKTKGDRNR